MQFFWWNVCMCCKTCVHFFSMNDGEIIIFLSCYFILFLTLPSNLTPTTPSCSFNFREGCYGQSRQTPHSSFFHCVLLCEGWDWNPGLPAVDILEGTLRGPDLGLARVWAGGTSGFTPHACTITARVIPKHHFLCHSVMKNAGSC